MTAEEVIKHFESYIGNECYTDFHQNACRMAVAALRAQQTSAKLDRSRWGCEWCSFYKSTLPQTRRIAYCEKCGCPLTEEAWAEMERKIGGNNAT